MKPMLPTLTDTIPVGNDWYYEVKYDGFRAILIWDEQIQILSRNGKPLSRQFPEIQTFCEKYYNVFQEFLPMILDGELVSLENRYRSNFATVAYRGKLKSPSYIKEASEKTPCQYLAFDLLTLKGQDIRSQSYLERKKRLMNLFEQIGMPLYPTAKDNRVIQMIPYMINFPSIWNSINIFNGEGVVAKKQNNKWEEGKRTKTWFKYKNWKSVTCFITSVNKNNGYFGVSVYKNDMIFSIGQFLHGLSNEELTSLHQIIRENSINEDSYTYFTNPAIVVELNYLELYENTLREPRFKTFRFDLTPEDCTELDFVVHQKNWPKEVTITHPDKPIWHTPSIQKIDYLNYLQEISPYLLPFLHNRYLTLIRFPHGISGEFFFQKNAPTHLPEYVKYQMMEDKKVILCQDLQTLLWLGNALTLEFHIPFSTIPCEGPSEITFDLDPPSRDELHLAVKAACLLKKILDELELISFVKTSGSKGLQVYIPLPDNLYSYEETKLFTTFIANYLVALEPELFTIERMKKKRGTRLYIDYIQHAEGKTIIAPYSTRGKTDATVACPLYWEEVNEHLRIENYHLTMMAERITKNGDPFRAFFASKELQNFDAVLRFLKENKQ